MSDTEREPAESVSKLEKEEEPAEATTEPAEPEADEEDEEAAIEEERSYIFEERLARGAELRAEGNELFGAGQLDEAMQLYRRALHHAEFEEMSYNFELQDEHREMVDKV